MSSELLPVGDVASSLGTTPERVVELWQMLGLRPPAAGHLAHDDAALLGRLLQLVRRHGGDEDTAALLARSFGHHTARLVTWQALGIAEGLTGPDGDAAPSAASVMRAEVDALEGLLVDVWRRHLDAVLAWRTGRDSEEAHDLVLTVAFVDLVGYTALTADMDGRQVSALVREFERVCLEVVAVHGGRIVKSLGDELLFVCDDVEPAVRAGAALAARAHAHPLLPEVRVGLSTGAVSAAQGDVFGVTVNRAHRITQRARPGTVAVDEATARAVPHLDLAAEGVHDLQGLGQVAVWSVAPLPAHGTGA